ncbi:hypothetical protein FF38_02162 [Lucilia cuprina]|uniref:Uncharacterized protein n=1 Tax=Lucilia cuprina TaxID=7375 RepID=A0A0L0CP31_LUCCU|nr:hypothetical protein FF38_02162 [Lucilia cuprina]
MATKSATVTAFHLIYNFSGKQKTQPHPLLRGPLEAPAGDGPDLFVMLGSVTTGAFSLIDVLTEVTRSEDMSVLVFGLPTSLPFGTLQVDVAIDPSLLHGHLPNELVTVFSQMSPLDPLGLFSRGCFLNSLTASLLQDPPRLSRSVPGPFMLNNSGMEVSKDNVTVLDCTVQLPIILVDLTATTLQQRFTMTLRGAVSN